MDVENTIDRRSFAAWLANPSLLVDLEARYAELANELGFDRYLLAFRDCADSSKNRNVSNYPDQPWIRNNPDILERDPLRDFAINCEGNIVWEPSFYTDSGNGDIWECGKADGIAAGVVSVVNIDKSKRIIVSASIGSYSKTDIEHLRQASTAFVLAGSGLAGSFASVYKKSDELREKLTTEQIDYLKYIFDGLSRYEIAYALKIPSNRVIYHLDLARRTLNATTDFEAAIIIAQCGLLN